MSSRARNRKRQKLTQAEADEIFDDKNAFAEPPGKLVKTKEPKPDIRSDGDDDKKQNKRDRGWIASSGGMDQHAGTDEGDGDAMGTEPPTPPPKRARKRLEVHELNAVSQDGVRQVLQRQSKRAHLEAKREAEAGPPPSKRGRGARGRAQSRGRGGGRGSNKQSPAPWSDVGGWQHPPVELGGGDTSRSTSSKKNTAAADARNDGSNDKSENSAPPPSSVDDPSPDAWEDVELEEEDATQADPFVQPCGVVVAPANSSAAKRSRASTGASRRPGISGADRAAQRLRHQLHLVVALARLRADARACANPSFVANMMSLMPPTLLRAVDELSEHAVSSSSSSTSTSTTSTSSAKKKSSTSTSSSKKAASTSTPSSKKTASTTSSSKKAASTSTSSSTKTPSTPTTGGGGSGGATTERALQVLRSAALWLASAIDSLAVATTTTTTTTSAAAATTTTTTTTTTITTVTAKPAEKSTKLTRRSARTTTTAASTATTTAAAVGATPPSPSPSPSPPSLTSATDNARVGHTLPLRLNMAFAALLCGLGFTARLVAPLPVVPLRPAAPPRPTSTTTTTTTTTTTATTLATTTLATATATTSGHTTTAMSSVASTCTTTAATSSSSSSSSCSSSTVATSPSTATAARGSGQASKKGGRGGRGQGRARGRVARESSPPPPAAARTRTLRQVTQREHSNSDHSSASESDSDFEDARAAATTTARSGGSRGSTGCDTRGTVRSGSRTPRRDLFGSNASASTSSCMWTKRWVEVYLPTSGWTYIDAHTPHAKESPGEEAARQCVYMVAVGLESLSPDSGMYFRDCTARYVPRWSALTGLRAGPWWDELLVALSSCAAPHDAEDASDLQAKRSSEPLPTSLSAYRSHPLYATQKTLRKFEIIHPLHPVLGTVRGEDVFPRANVQLLHTRERWEKEGRCVRPGEEPARYVKPSAFSNSFSTGVSTPVFGIWQTDALDKPAAENGIVPTNAHGNVVLDPLPDGTYKGLPDNTTHLALPNVAKVCKKLGVNFAKAMVGFERHKGRSYPRFLGVVVCTESAALVVEAHAQAEAAALLREEARRVAALRSKWVHLLQGLRARARARAVFAMNQTATEKATKTTTLKSRARHAAREHTHVFGEPKADPISGEQVKACSCGFTVRFETI